MSRHIKIFVAILALTAACLMISLPDQIQFQRRVLGRDLNLHFEVPPLAFVVFGKTYQLRKPLKQGLDIQGGMQVVLQADMSNIATEDRSEALAAAKQVIERRVDLYGISEPVIQTSQQGENYRLIVELAGVDDSQEALSLIGTTAQLDFRLEDASSSALLPDGQAEATISAVAFLNQFYPTGLTGQQLRRSVVNFDPQTGEPVVSLEFDETGRELFANITTNHVGERLAIFLDGLPLMTPVIQTPIANGQASITGSFTVDEAKNLSIQLNAGALPVPITVLEQRNIGASLGQASVQASVKAGVIGIGLVMIFMILFYGYKGLIASLALGVYSVLTIAIYKVLGVTLTLPGIAGLLLSIGMAVDANILIFERMKEELRDGQPYSRAMELGFGRAWDSIKDANLATISTSLVLINPFNFSFLSTSGLVRGFGITLLIGVIISLFTGIVVTRTLMRLFLKDSTRSSVAV